MRSDARKRIAENQVATVRESDRLHLMAVLRTCRIEDAPIRLIAERDLYHVASMVLRAGYTRVLKPSTTHPDSVATDTATGPK